MWTKAEQRALERLLTKVQEAALERLKNAQSRDERREIVSDYLSAHRLKKRLIDEG